MARMADTSSHTRLYGVYSDGVYTRFQDLALLPWELVTVYSTPQKSCEHAKVERAQGPPGQEGKVLKPCVAKALNCIGLHRFGTANLDQHSVKSLRNSFTT